MNLVDKIKKIEPDKKESPFLHALYEGFFTFLYTPNETTSGTGVHIRDRMDLKRTMVIVVLAMQLCYLFGTYNIGHQHFAALGQYTGFLEGIHLKLAYGLIKILPIFIVSNVVGLAIEFYYAAKRGHGIEEGYLVTGALIPLIMPPDIPLWILTLAIVFAVVLGKEAFGGTGMNVVNVALLARAFIFFAYPTTISGDQCWIAGLEYQGANVAGEMYGWAEGFFDWIFGGLGWDTFGKGGMAVADAYTGATPLGLATQGWDKVTEVYSPMQMLWGAIPGSIGETSKPLIIAGGLVLLATGIASWRIMLSGILGAAAMALLLNVWDFDAYMDIPWFYHFYMGSFWFAIVFMATDPVTAAGTNMGKWIYGFFIGILGIMIRVMNPAYPEGWMLAIIFMNVFSPLIDYFVVQANINRRLKRVKAGKLGN
ncbi:MAG TPA: NADH:ubiquinone reductase (Na(+)-transporting) subunit B [Bacteroidetes bacterium]|nr:NADH:ubiquinone reductase (Na(+)-transporting) subunit B [Bacteroidota bacterium]